MSKKKLESMGFELQRKKLIIEKLLEALKELWEQTDQTPLDDDYVNKINKLIAKAEGNDHE